MHGQQDIKKKLSKRIWCMLEDTFSEQHVTQILLHHGARDMRTFGGGIFQIWIEVSREINWSWSLSSGGERERRRLFQWQPINTAGTLQDSVEAKVPRCVRVIHCRIWHTVIQWMCRVFPFVSCMLILLHVCHDIWLICKHRCNRRYVLIEVLVAK